MPRAGFATTTSTAYVQLSTNDVGGSRPLILNGTVSNRIVIADSAPTFASETAYYSIAATANTFAIVADPKRLWVGGANGQVNWMDASS